MRFATRACCPSSGPRVARRHEDPRTFSASVGSNQPPGRTPSEGRAVRPKGPRPRNACLRHLARLGRGVAGLDAVGENQAGESSSRWTPSLDYTSGSVTSGGVCARSLHPQRGAKEALGTRWNRVPKRQARTSRDCVQFGHAVAATGNPLQFTGYPDAFKVSFDHSLSMICRTLVREEILEKLDGRGKGASPEL